MNEDFLQITPREAFEVVREIQSPYQTVRLLKHDSAYLLDLNGSPQVYSPEERLYHECIGTFPMMMIEETKDIAILGGGDGLAARNILEFPESTRVSLVELDGAVIDVCKNTAAWKEISGNVFLDPRLEVTVGDAIQWLIDSKSRFDLIVHDIEDCWTNQPDSSVDRYLRFYQAMFEKLKPGGILVLTIDDDDASDETAGEIYRMIKKDLPQAVRKEFEACTDGIERTKVLLRSLFPYVYEWSIDFPELGTHTTLFMTKTPLTGVRRKLEGKKTAIDDALVEKILKSGAK